MVQLEHSQRYILAVDQSTTSSSAFIFDHGGGLVSSATQEITQFHPEAGWVDQDPEEIIRSIMVVAHEAIASAKLTSEQVSAIGITNQRETTVIWERATCLLYTSPSPRD